MCERLERLGPQRTRGAVRLSLIAQRAAAAAILVLLPVALWCLTHRYRGLVGDAELYAVQAISRTNAGLAHDVFLSYTSQDRYTTFSPLYAFFIKQLGLQAAALSLLIFFKLSFFASAWAFSRRLFDARAALLTIALLIIVPLEYGAFHVFRVAEDMLTARSMAEALAMAALALHVRGQRTAGLAVAACALTIHALMALPMALLLLSLRAGARASFHFAVAAVAAVLCVASAAAVAPEWMPSLLRVMDPSWLEMVRERSQFVFLQLWRLADWESTARPFISLALSMLVIRAAHLRTLCASAMIVGVAGLAIALVAGLIGPIPILLQGQAWRWTWVTQLMGVLMLAPTALHLWRAERCGLLCAVLFLIGWLVSNTHGVYFIATAFCLWQGRTRIPSGAAPYLRAAAALISVLVLVRIIEAGWAALSSAPPYTGPAHGALLLARTLLGLDYLPVVFVFLLGSSALNSRSVALRGLMTLGLATAIGIAAPSALQNPLTEGTDGQIKEFSDWRNAIPPGDNVFIAPRYYSAGFAWFTLHRPSYLTVNQSSGVIFSRATATEVRRRAEVLLPMEQQDWRLLSRRSTHAGKFDATALPLTRDRLVRICKDPVLNFVIARENVGFAPIRHRVPGIWNGWNLYDCRHVNSSGHSQ